jgi:alpha-N-arabinofuranosidase
MFEDINHSGDGGLYGELLRNRGFEGSNIEWGTIADIPGNSIIWQENSCDPLGKVLSSTLSMSCANRMQDLSSLAIAH